MGFPAFSLLVAVGVGAGCPAPSEQGTLAVMIRSNEDAARLRFAVALATLVGPASKTISISARQCQPYA